MMKGTRGSIILTIIFMTLVMFMGLSLLNVSILHNRINRARQAHRIRSEFLHNTLISHLHSDQERIKTTRFNSAIENLSLHFNQSLYPDIDSVSFTLRRSFRFRSRDFATFRMIHGVYGLDASDPGKKGTWRSRSTFSLISGDIPFRLIPVIINPPALPKPDNEKWRREISTEEPNHMVVTDQPAVFCIRQYLAALLNLDPEDLSMSAIGSLYGKTPIENGIWLDEDRLDALPVFVHGDADHIRLGVSEKTQVIQILSGSEQLTIRYANDHCHYESRDSNGSSDGTFLQKFIINGDVKSLESDGFPALADQSRPEFIVLGNTVISSSITGNNENGSDAEPPFITIIVSPSPFNSGFAESFLSFSPAGIIRVNGSLLVNGTVLNENPHAILAGNLYCRNLKGRGKIEVRKTQLMPEGTGDNFFLTDLSFVRDIRTDALEEVFESEQ